MPDKDKLAEIVDRVPDLDEGGKKGRSEGKLTGPPWPEAVRDIFDPVLAGGKKAVMALIDRVKPVDNGEDYKVRYTLHGLSMVTCRKGKEKERAAVIDAYTTALGQDRPASIKEFLVWELETVGDARAVPALAAFLDDETVGPDAVRTLVAIGDGAAEPIRKALAKSKGPMRLHLVQAAGQLGDKAAIPEVRKAVKSDDEDLRVTARWVLATLGDAASADACLAGAEARDWERVKGVKACLVLAETLAADGNKAAARDVYERLKKACAAEDDAYVREACDRGLKAIA
ncbi:MAG: HEAT repeat domain-containing protein [Phycisphaerae bacterium]